TVMAFMKAGRFRDALITLQLPFVEKSDLQFLSFKLTLFSQWDAEKRATMKKTEIEEWKKTIDQMIDQLQSKKKDFIADEGEELEGEILLELTKLYHDRSYCNVQLNLPQEALKDLEKIAKYDPSSMDQVMIQRGHVLQAMGKTMDATQSIEHAMKLAQGTDRYYDHLVTRAQFRRLKGLFLESIGDCTRIIQEASDKINPTVLTEIKIMRIESMIQLKKYKEAEEECNRMIHQDGSSWELYCLRGLVYHDQQDATSSVRDFKKALDMNEEGALARYPHIYGMIGSLLRTSCEEKGDNQKKAEAEFYLQRALEKSDQTEWKLQLALLYSMDKKFGKTIDLCNEILLKNPKSAEAFFLRAGARAGKRQFEGALKDIEQTLTLNPQFQRAADMKQSILRDRKTAYTRAGIPMNEDGSPTKEWMQQEKERRSLEGGTKSTGLGRKAPAPALKKKAE
ncbi:hypothetical protein PROFUN_13089, partial [Planoprotostelium fungivorum]